MSTSRVRLVCIDSVDGITTDNFLHTHPHLRPSGEKHVFTHADVGLYFKTHYPEIKTEWLFKQFPLGRWIQPIPADKAWKTHCDILDGYLYLMGMMRDHLTSKDSHSVWITNSYIHEFTHHTSLDRSLTLKQRADLLEHYRLTHQSLFKNECSLRVLARGINYPTTCTGLRGTMHDYLEQVRVNDLYTYNESVRNSIYWLNAKDFNHVFAKHNL